MTMPCYINHIILTMPQYTLKRERQEVLSLILSNVICLQERIKFLKFSHSKLTSCFLMIINYPFTCPLRNDPFCQTKLMSCLSLFVQSHYVMYKHYACINICAKDRLMTLVFFLSIHYQLHHSKFSRVK